LSAQLVPEADTAISAGRPEPRWARRPGRRSLSVGVARLLTALALLLIWQYAPQGVVPTVAVSRPVDVARSFGQLVSTGELFSGTWATAEQVLYSLVLGALIGVALAILTWGRIGRWLLGPLISAGYAIPKVGLISFYILLLGVDTKAHVVFVTGFVLFAYYFAVRDAFDELDRDKLTALRLMGAGRLALLRVYVLPSAVPHLFTATRIAVPLAFASEVFAELEMPTATGLGVSLQKATDSLDTSTGMAIALFIVLIGYLLDLLIGARLRRYTESVGTGLML
jgi:ABC-type nitrate/sulfonate/bicarbonate transport system permease component